MSDKKTPIRSKELLDIQTKEEKIAELLRPAPTNETRKEKPNFKFEPPSELLSRLQAFIPELASANEQLEKQVKDDPNKLDIEQIDENAEGYIEMNLGLGVFDLPQEISDNDINIKPGEKGGATDKNEQPSIVMLSNNNEFESSEEEEDGEGNDFEGRPIN
ncbi:uncharacterized protein VTP21DRAFT_1762 [Calcarisporiella thermophila]|uniref:uncharacterized protein n=1 Tax=Calcarisporiella thermophila TaxID=911321 RepID=UPI0037443A0F